MGLIGLLNEKEIVNRIELAGDKLGITYTAEDETETRVVEPENPGRGSTPVNTEPVKLQPAQTGDAAPVYVLGFAAIILTAAILLFIRSIRKKRK